MIEIWASFNMAIVSHLFFVSQVAPMVFKAILFSKCLPILEKNSCLPSSGSSKYILLSLKKKKKKKPWVCYIAVSVCAVSQSCLTLCRPVDCSLPGSSVHGIFQAGILEWVDISCSRGSSRPDIKTVTLASHLEVDSLPLVTPEKPLYGCT